MTLSGIASYPNGESTALIKYYFNEDNNTQNQYEVQVDSNDETFTKPITFPNDLPENNHTIHIYLLKDGFNSKTYNLSFEYIYNPPIISITTAPKSSYTKNTDENIIVTGTVSDRDGEDQIDIYCQFDNETPTKEISRSVNDIDVTYEFDFTVKIPSSFSEGTHIIYIWAVDSNQKQSDHLHYQFDFNYNTPSISITTENNQQIRKGINNQIEIKGNVTDLDGSGTVTINYIIDDNGLERLVERITIYNTSSHEFNKNIDIPSYLNEGIHKVTIYCYDESLKKSNEENINFIYIFNNPSLIVNKEPLSTYHNKIDRNITVSGTFTNENNAEHIYFFYVIDNSSRHEIEDITITNEHEFTFFVPYRKGSLEK